MCDFTGLETGRDVSNNVLTVSDGHDRGKLVVVVRELNKYLFNVELPRIYCGFITFTWLVCFVRINKVAERCIFKVGLSM